MRRPLALLSAVCVLCVAACSETGDDGDAGAPETVDDLAEQGPSGLALLHRGHEGGDPETDQTLVFHDPETGQPEQRFGLPEGAVDAMAEGPQVHAQFSEDWMVFVYATEEPNAVNIAMLTEAEDAESSSPEDEESGEDPTQFSYEAVESVPPANGEVVSDPVVHEDRVWYVSDAPEGPNPPQVLSVPLEAPTGTPNQEGTLALGENQAPSDWALTPEGALHIRDSVQTEQLNGGGNLVVRRTGETVVNATLTTDGEQWQTFDGAAVWGEGTALLRPDPSPEDEDPPPGAYLVEADGQDYTEARLLEDESGPVVQYALTPERDAVLLQTEDQWFRIDLDDSGKTESTEEAFPVLHDSSMNGWPLAVRWVRDPVPVDPSSAPSPDAQQ
ncbi:hypothetical protein [Nocardiopsis xinjiangensis]|uniref:hypothetical protein n=1 Tax=Nocardiopsis xinjiangensis TaxID=124285 RepID=UPI00034B4421|nr:hypothetical protein [Nocardiopsis xinjiangensis]